METKVCHVIKIWTSFQKINSRLLVQEEHGFQKGAQCDPLASGAKKPGLDRVKLFPWQRSNCIVTFGLDQKVLEYWF